MIPEFKSLKRDTVIWHFRSGGRSEKVRFLMWSVNGLEQYSIRYSLCNDKGPGSRCLTDSVENFARVDRRGTAVSDLSS